MSSTTEVACADNFLVDSRTAHLNHRRRYARTFLEDRLLQLERNEEGFLVDASLLSELLNVPSARIQDLMRQNKITSVCERGEGEHEGQYRLTFFYKGRRARLNVDPSGHVIRRSIVDFGDHLTPAARK